MIEFNARFGDPRRRSVLPRLRSPLYGPLAAATGRLEAVEPLRWDDGAAVTVVVAADGYPVAPRTGDVVTGLDLGAKVDGAYVLHAGTARRDGEIVSSGGRVLSVVGTGCDLADARERAYHAVAYIGLEGGHYRSDIAEAAAHGLLSPPASQTSPAASQTSLAEPQTSRPRRRPPRPSRP